MKPEEKLISVRRVILVRVPGGCAAGIEILIPVRKLLPVSRKCGVSDSSFHFPISFKHLAPVVQKLDSAFHRINHYPVDKCFGNQWCYPLDGDLSGG